MLLTFENHGSLTRHQFGLSQVNICPQLKCCSHTYMRLFHPSQCLSKKRWIESKQCFRRWQNQSQIDQFRLVSHIDVLTWPMFWDDPKIDQTSAGCKHSYLMTYYDRSLQCNSRFLSGREQTSFVLCWWRSHNPRRIELGPYHRRGTRWGKTGSFPLEFRNCLASCVNCVLWIN